MLNTDLNNKPNPAILNLLLNFNGGTPCLIATGHGDEPFCELYIDSLYNLRKRINFIDAFNGSLTRNESMITIDAEPIVTRWQDCKRILDRVHPKTLTDFITKRMGL